MKSEIINNKATQKYKRTIEKPVMIEYVEKKSKFYAQGFPVTNLFEVEKNLEILRENSPKADHICFAYVIGIEKDIYKFSDDREPNGTAGKPILQTILNFDLTDILVVVLRYFGGIKLGVSGLIRAYSTATKLLLQSAKIIEIPLSKEISLEIEYSDYPRIQSILNSYLIDIKANYGINIKIIGKVPCGLIDEFYDKVSNILSKNIR
ncbi:MAG: YigZ family protein [Ignavibacteria bacterium]|nr:YigZ family protein [Ignavibacteria bacterium]